MPFDPSGRFYRGDVEAYRFEVAPTYTTASSTGASVDVGAFETLDATLGVHQFVKTSLAGANNDLVWIDRTAGASALSLIYAVSGANTALGVALSSSVITVTVATNASSVAVSTAAEVLAFVNDDEAASAVEQAAAVSLAPGNDGTGAVVALGSTPFAGPGGTNTPTLTAKLQYSIDGGTTWEDSGTFTGATAAGSQQAEFNKLGDHARWVVTLGGSSPTFAYSVAVEGREGR